MKRNVKLNRGETIGKIFVRFGVASGAYPAMVLSRRMKPQIILAEAHTREGARLTLHSHDGRFSIRVNGKELMNSAATASEVALGELATAEITRSAPARILIGGLGLGYTLQGVLAKVGAHATVHVAELVSAVIDWNRTHMSGLNGALLNDPRVKILNEDVRSIIARSANQPYDAILLDIDNGPRPWSSPVTPRSTICAASRASDRRSSPADESPFGRLARTKRLKVVFLIADST